MAEDKEPVAAADPAAVQHSLESPAATTMHLAAVGERPAEGSVSGAGPVLDAELLASLQPGTALLQVMQGSNSGSRFLLDGPMTTVGRHPNSDIFLDDVTVSRKHAEFLREGGHFLVRDVGSLNGTYVNRQRVDSCSLATGDEVQVGKFRLVVHVSEAG
ncbi:MAG: FHA domain-containing protein [Angustibacter sp.]